MNRDSCFQDIQFDDVSVAALKRLTPGQRAVMAADCNRTARLLIAAQLRARRPEWSDERIAAEAARRMLGALEIISR